MMQSVLLLFLLLTISHYTFCLHEGKPHDITDTSQNDEDNTLFIEKVHDVSKSGKSSYHDEDYDLGKKVRDLRKVKSKYQDELGFSTDKIFGSRKSKFSYFDNVYDVDKISDMRKSAKSGYHDNDFDKEYHGYQGWGQGGKGKHFGGYHHKKHSHYNPCGTIFEKSGFCFHKYAGHYAHSNPKCYIQCDAWGRGYIRPCAKGTYWVGGKGPTKYNKCVGRYQKHGGNKHNHGGYYGGGGYGGSFYGYRGY